MIKQWVTYLTFGVIIVTFGGAVYAQVEVNNSGTLLASSDGRASTSNVGALTFQSFSSATEPVAVAQPISGASIASPLGTSAFASSPSTYSTAKVFSTPESGFAFMTVPDSDSLVTFSELQPVPEPSTWWAAALAAAVVLYGIVKRFAHRLGPAHGAASP